MTRNPKNPPKPEVLESPAPLSVLNASYAATGSFASDMMQDKNKRAVTQRVFDERKRFACFSDADAALLTELGEVFERHSDSIVGKFYEHLMNYDELKPLLSDPSSVGRLKEFQRDYLLSLASGEYGADHVENRLLIGKVHDRIGLDPEWYLGTYGLYMDLLFPLIRQRFDQDTDRAIQASAALGKLMILDMQLVLDAYHGIQQRRAVEHTEQLAAVGELAASIAHEVRNPLAGMKGALEVLRRELSVNPENREIIDELLAQIVRLEHLVRDLLTFARPRAIDRQPFDLQDLLDRLLRLYKDQAEAQGVTVNRTYGPGTSRLTADPRQTEQVLLNLIHNALQAMPEGGTLSVTTQVMDGSTRLTFIDTGEGIPPADLPKIFQPFFTTKHRGSGLGLSIVKKIVEAHGGTVEVKSEPGRGTAVTVTIPNREPA